MQAVSQSVFLPICFHKSNYGLDKQIFPYNFILLYFLVDGKANVNKLNVAFVMLWSKLCFCIN